MHVLGIFYYTAKKSCPVLSGETGRLLATLLLYAACVHGSWAFAATEKGLTVSNYYCIHRPT